MLPAQPLLTSLVLALGAVSVTARMITVPSFVALVTVENMATKRFRATMLNRPHRFSVAGRHSLTILLPIRRPIAAEDSCQFYHDKSFINWSILTAVSSLLLSVK